MKVLYIADQYSYGGAAKALIEMIILLRDRYGVEPLVGTAFNDALAEELDKHGICHVFLGHRQFCFNYSLERGRMRLFVLRPLYKLRYLFANINAKRNARKSIDFSKIDLIHTNVNRNDIGGVLARKYKIPHIWHIREFQKGHFNLIFNRRNAFDYMNIMTDCFINISGAIRDSWVTQGIDLQKSIAIYDGVDYEGVPINPLSLTYKSVLKIVCIGEITRSKGQHILIDALYICKLKGISFKVDFYGSGDEKYSQELEIAVRDYKLEGVVSFMGYCSNVSGILNEYDIGVNPSTGEGFGRTSVEYMGAGLITILKEDEISREILGDNHCGYVFNGVEDLAKLLISIESNRNEAEIIARSGRERARKMFDINNNIENIFKLYQKIITK